MIPRYTRAEIGEAWAQQRKLETWLEVELAATEAWAAEGVVPEADAAAVRERAAFTGRGRGRARADDEPRRRGLRGRRGGVHRRARALAALRAHVLGRARHGAGRPAPRRGRDRPRRRARLPRRPGGPRPRARRDALRVGRTHGIHAEPTTFRLRLAGFAFEADRNLRRLTEAFEQLRVGKLSGAVGTYASVPPAVEARVMEKLGLEREDVATQVVPRDRHAVLLSAVALAGNGLERRPRSATSSAPRSARSRSPSARARRARRRCRTSATRSRPSASPAWLGCSGATRRRARERRALARARHLALWSRARRRLPDATIGLDYMQHLATRVAAEMNVRTDRAREPRAHPRRALQPARPDGAGRCRDGPRRRVPRRPGERPACLGRAHRLPRAARRRCADLDLDAVFDYDAYLEHVPAVMARLDELK